MRRNALRLGLGISAAAFAVLLGFVLLRGEGPIGVESIRFAEIDGPIWKATIRMSCMGGGVVPMRVTLTPVDGGHDLSVSMFGVDRSPANPISVFRLQNAGVVALGSSRADHVFLEETSGIGGNDTAILTLYDPAARVEYQYSMWWEVLRTEQTPPVIFMNDALAALPADAPQRRFFEAMREHFESQVDWSHLAVQGDNP